MCQTGSCSKEVWRSLAALELWFCASVRKSQTVEHRGQWSILVNLTLFLLSISIGSLQLDFQKMTCNQSPIRRISTPSSVAVPNNVFATKWIWYWKDDFDRCVQYGEKVRSIPRASLPKCLASPWLPVESGCGRRGGAFYIIHSSVYVVLARACTLIETMNKNILLLFLIFLNSF